MVFRYSDPLNYYNNKTSHLNTVSYFRKKPLRLGSELIYFPSPKISIEAWGKEQLNAVESYLKQLIAHRFKLEYVNDQYYRRGWQKEINTFKDGIEDRLTNALKRKINLEKVYQRAKRDLLIDYPELKNKLPEKSPYSLDEWLNQVY